MTFIQQYSGPIIYFYVTTIPFLALAVYYKLQESQCVDDKIAHKMIRAIHLKCEVPVTEKENVAECSLCDAASHYFPKNYSCGF